MVFEPTEGYDPVTWTGDVVGPEERSGKRSGTARPQEGGRKRG
jgi:hypothetical protein